MSKQSEPLKKARDFRARMDRLLTDEAERLRFWEALEKALPGYGKVLRKNPLRPWTHSQTQELIRALGRDPWSEEPRGEPRFLGNFARLKSAEEVKALGRHPLMGQGFLFVQEGGASEVVEHLNPKPGEWVLDLCAAPGAKSTHILEKLAHEGVLWANEPDRLRVQKLDALTARHGAENVIISSAYPSQLSPHLEKCFDAILVDAPCSGESLWAKRADWRRDIKNQEVYQCQTIQKDILHHAALMAAPRSRIMYSTCTYARDENEDVVEDFLKRHPEWKLLKSQRRWPHLDGVPGGYWALLCRGWSDSPMKSRQDELFERSLRLPESQVIRRGLRRSDGQLDEYAASMSSRRDSARKIFELSSSQEAIAFLRGESLAVPANKASLQTQDVDVFFAGHCLGFARQVPGRLNNLLPKTLRIS